MAFGPSGTAWSDTSGRTRMMKVNRIAIIVIGMAWCSLIGSCGKRATQPPPLRTRQPASQPAKALLLDLGNRVQMKLTLISPGKFVMGSPEIEEGRTPFEAQHEVTISYPFHMGIYPVIQEQYEQVMGNNPSQWRGAKDPVQNISWNEANEFCMKLSQRTGLSVRLPTEAQWEYACRAGTTTKFFWGDSLNNLNDYSWSRDRFDVTPCQPAVGLKRPNGFGLYDMCGNVWQWCSDWFASDYYLSSPTTDPLGLSSGRFHVVRGGSWREEPRCYRSAYRYGSPPDHQSWGCRVCVDVWTDDYTFLIGGERLGDRPP